MERINRLKVVLVEQNKTGKWLAETLGKNEATVSRWCSNVYQPSLETLADIAKILNVDIRELLVATRRKNIEKVEDTKNSKQD
ncbi:MAG: helix-turn-helix transcriptional regulator [Flavobacteriaceae bacterium]|jgi:transcriptional regulator with XRE-family HTH domain|nr:helix-turn-helix transcriptional regulator [Flavobacteriaceae bacterium]